LKILIGIDFKILHIRKQKLIPTRIFVSQVINLKVGKCINLASPVGASLAGEGLGGLSTEDLKVSVGEGVRSLGCDSGHQEGESGDGLHCVGGWGFVRWTGGGLISRSKQYR